jgi:hypothetical protein
MTTFASERGRRAGYLRNVLNRLINFERTSGDGGSLPPALNQKPAKADNCLSGKSTDGKGDMTIGRRLVISILMSALAVTGAGPALAQACTRQGADVSCDDGRRGILSGGAIIWPDGTRSSLTSPHPSVIVGNKSSVIVGKGVFVGRGTGVVPMENPSDPNKARCPVLDGVAYCY